MKDLLVKMAVREIWTQCKFAEISYSNINVKAQVGNDAIFSSIHSFLSHCANVSKFLWSKKLTSSSEAQDLAQILGIPKSYKIKKMKFRNVLEHYDKELTKWVETKGENILILDYNIGPKKVFEVGKNSIRIRQYDNTTDTFTLLDEDLNLGALYQEVLDIKSKADHWIKDLEKKQRLKK